PTLEGGQHARAAEADALRAPDASARDRAPGYETAPARAARARAVGADGSATYEFKASSEFLRSSASCASPLMMERQLISRPLRFPFSVTFTPSGAIAIV